MAYFLTVEGVEGVGKSTNIQFMYEYLTTRGVDVLLTREPGGTPLAESIRDLLLTSREELISDEAELLMIFAARAQHILNVIKPALDRGQWVLCDRFTDASFAYQGGGRGVSNEIISELEKMVQRDLQPDRTLLLDCDVQTGMQRVRARGHLDRFEQEKLAFFERVRSTYLARAQQYSNRFYVVAADQPLDNVQANIAKMLDDLLAK